MSTDTVSQPGEVKELAEFAFGKMEQYFDAAKNVIEQYGGDVAELGLMALRIEAASTLVTPLIFTLLGVMGLAMTAKHGIKAVKPQTRTMASEEMKALVAVSGVVSSVFFIFGFVELIDLWAWAGVFYPELYAVHKFILK